MKTAKHPSGLIMTFNDEKHRYVDESGQVYNSVTKVIHELFPKFEAEKIAGFVARKRGCLREEVLAEWETKRKASSDFGSKIHSYAESLLTGEKFKNEYERNIDSYHEKEKSYMKQVEKIVPNLLKSYDLIGSEHIIFSPENRLSGTVDILMRNKRTGQLAIFDWKTNEEIRNQNKHKATQSGMYGLSHILDANFNHYALQLNTYRMILIKEGYYSETDYELAIFHIRETEVVPYRLPLMEKEALYLTDMSKDLKEEDNEGSLFDND
jgi:hypothetical protein